MPWIANRPDARRPLHRRDVGAARRTAQDRQRRRHPRRARPARPQFLRREIPRLGGPAACDDAVVAEKADHARPLDARRRHARRGGHLEDLHRWRTRRHRHQTRAAEDREPAIGWTGSARAAREGALARVSASGIANAPPEEIRNHFDRAACASRHAGGLVFTPRRPPGWGKLAGRREGRKDQRLPARPHRRRSRRARREIREVPRARRASPATPRKGKTAAALCQACHLIGPTGGQHRAEPQRRRRDGHRGDPAQHPHAECRDGERLPHLTASS